MSQCVALLNGYIVTSNSSCDYALLSATELEELQTGLDGNLNIDSQLYTSVTGYLLLSLVGGHILGRIVKGLGRG
ncbi:hypothetical protein SBW85_15170 [Vibrio plantisponsor]|uniref:Uncharacterized protein n=2 Tax=Vibrio TaxID=662 RepID=A0A2J8HYY2_VIBDI|nr:MULTISPECIES: hypothetical protein [Vibrio]MDW6019039.1 hypothetical protein [Vibrio plantisponsor]NNM41055.1 hypothetical protein [Vibrio plantisponsor]PNI03464.1 hypothetical protein C1N32_16560 [Vibrio diazotrophicus]